MSNRSLRNERVREEMVARIRGFSPVNPRCWGEMAHSQILAHMGDALRLALGEIGNADWGADAPFASGRREWIHELPWPKGKAQAPSEAFVTAPTDWEADRELLLDLVARFADAPTDQLASSHPLLGEMSGDDWDVLMFRHLDHHLCQFGV